MPVPPTTASAESSASRVRFEKWHGLGNDFILVQDAALALPEDIDRSGLFARWCDRRRGIGADGVLLVDDQGPDAFRLRIYNADGTVAEMCGNGVRCAVRSWAHRQSLASGEVEVQTDAGPRRCHLSTDGQVTVEMGAPVLTAPHLPEPAEPGQPARVEVVVSGRKVVGWAVSMGNPHLVLLADAPWEAVDPVEARSLEHHPAFPQRTNVSFAHVVSPSRIDLVVWERGVGYTQACGSGACATAAMAQAAGRVSSGQDIDVVLPGGVLVIRVGQGTDPIVMRGPAVRTYTGVVSVAH